MDGSAPCLLVLILINTVTMIGKQNIYSNMNGLNKLSLREKYQKIGFGIENGDVKLILDCVFVIRKDLSIGIFKLF